MKGGMLTYVTLAAGIAALTCAAGGVGLAWLEVISPDLGGGLYALSGLLGLFAMGLGIACLFTSAPTAVACIGLFGALPAILLVGGLAASARYPAINDITTDLQDPPQFENAAALPANAGRDLRYPDRFKAIVAEAYPELNPLHLDRAPAETFAHALEVAAEQPRWTVLHVDQEARTLEGVAETRLFRWRDDFVVRVRASSDGGSIVDMRSKSRSGQGDLGANAKRIHGFLQALQGEQAAAGEEPP